MKLWEIKAQALRLMFADSDMMLNEEDFIEGTIYDNHNTKEKLIRMEDSIRRGIDLYYALAVQPIRVEKFLLNQNEEEEKLNEIDFSHLSYFDNPSRVDVYVYNVSSSGKKTILTKKENLDFFYDNFSKKIYFFDNYDFPKFDYVEFMVWFKGKKLNLPFDVEELVYDLDEIFIPEEIQRALPIYIKSELYEEDEPNLSSKAKNDYLQVLYGIERPTTKVQKKVKRSKIFD